MFCLESGVAVAPACEEQRLDEGGLRPLGDGLDELEDRLGDPVVLPKHVEEPPCRKGERVEQYLHPHSNTDSHLVGIRGLWSIFLAVHPAQEGKN